MSIKDNINRLVDKPPPDNRLQGESPPAALRAKTGLEPLRRASKVDGTEVTVESTDGLFTFTVRVVKS